MGDRLIEQIATATGLPVDLISLELSRLLSASGVDAQNASLDDIRRVLAEYAQDVLLSAKDELDSTSTTDAQPKP